MPGGSINCNGNNVQFITLKGEAQALALAVEDVSRPGVDGHAYLEVGKRGVPFELVGQLDYISLSAAGAGYAAMVGWQGKLASFVDDYGLTGSNVMVLSVEKVRILPIRSATGGTLGSGAQALLVMRFLMQLT